MAQFVMQGSLKLLFNGEAVSSLLEHKDPFHYNFRSTQTRRRRRLLYIGSSGSIYYSSSSLSSKSNSCNAEARPSDCVYESDSDDDDFESDSLACFRGLALDVSYRPFNVVGWKRAICLEFMEKADVLEYYDQTVNSTSGSFYIPAVLRVPYLLQVVKRRIIKSNLSRKNILFRDNYTCPYCSSHENLTIDHVIPTALGGEWKWENLNPHVLLFGLGSSWYHPTKENIPDGLGTANGSLPGLKTVFMRLLLVLNATPKKNAAAVGQAPKDYDILAIPLTSAALRMLTKRKGTPEECRQYLRSSSEPRIHLSGHSFICHTLMIS